METQRSDLTLEDLYRLHGEKKDIGVRTVFQTV